MASWSQQDLADLTGVAGEERQRRFGLPQRELMGDERAGVEAAVGERGDRVAPRLAGCPEHGVDLDALGHEVPGEDGRGRVRDAGEHEVTASANELDAER